jgi:integrase
MRLFRRGKVFYYSLRRGHKQSLKTSDTSTAQRLFRKIEEAVIEGKLIKLSKTITLFSAIEQYLESRKIKKQKTYIADKTILKQFSEYFGDIEINRITLQKLQNWLSWLKDNRELRDTTLNIRIRHTKTFLKTMKQWGFLNGDPWAGWKQLRAISLEKYLLSDQDRQNILIGSQWYEHFRHIVPIMLFTGMAKNEFLSPMHISETEITMTRIKGNKPLSIPIADKLKPCLYGLSGIVRLFPYNSRHFDRLFRRMMDALGYTQVTSHCIRHTFITNKLKDGFSPKEISEVTGNTVDVINKCYSHIIPGRKKELVNS